MQLREDPEVHIAVPLNVWVVFVSVIFLFCPATTDGQAPAPATLEPEHEILRSLEGDWQVFVKDEVVVPGFSIHEELQNFVAAGFTPEAALISATREAARFLGDLDDWGTVERGKEANLLLLDSNPFDNIENVRQPAGVMIKGQWFPREELDRMLDSLRVDGAESGG